MRVHIEQAHGVRDARTQEEWRRAMPKRIEHANIREAREEEPWTPSLGDMVQFVGQEAKSMRFPEGTVGRYRAYFNDGTGYRGRVVGWIGKDLVVRTRRDSGNVPPGRGYGDYWAPVKDWKLISKGTGIEPPRVPSPGAWGGGGLEQILQRWAKSKGLPPIPSFDIEKFVQENPFIKEPTRPEWMQLGRRRKRIN